jgi:hypothetical protein
MKLFDIKLGNNALGWGIAMASLSLATELIKDYNVNRRITTDGAVRGTLAAAAMGVSTALGTQVFNNMNAKMQKATGIAFIASYLAGVFSNPEPKPIKNQPQTITVDAEICE